LTADLAGQVLVVTVDFSRERQLVLGVLGGWNMSNEKRATGSLLYLGA